MERMINIGVITIEPTSTIYVRWPGVRPVCVAPHSCITAVIDMRTFVNIYIYISFTVVYIRSFVSGADIVSSTVIGIICTVARIIIPLWL